MSSRPQTAAISSPAIVAFVGSPTAAIAHRVAQAHALTLICAPRRHCHLGLGELYRDGP